MNREQQEYLARAFGCGIHEGDTVRLVRSWTEEEGEHAGCVWMVVFNDLIGETGKIEKQDEDLDFWVRFDSVMIAAPYFVLEKVEDQ